jgi:hypothetical protein
LGQIYDVRATIVVPGNNGSYCETSGNFIIPKSTTSYFHAVIATNTSYDDFMGNPANNFSFRGIDPAELVSATVSAAAQKPFQDLLNDHVNDFTSYTGRFTLDLPDTMNSSTKETAPLIESYTIADGDTFVESLFFDLGRYLFISSERQNSLPDGATNSARAHSRDMAYVTWSKARQMVSKNIAATGSFRQSLSLVFFGLILPPSDGKEDDISEEDSTYALCEGLRRLQSLCTEAQVCVQGSNTDHIFIDPMKYRKIRKRSDAVQALPATVKETILELIGAIEWLTIITNIATIVTSHGKICPIPLSNDDSTATSVYMKQDMANIPERCNLSLLLSPTQRRERENDDLILLHARSKEQSFMKLWSQEPSDERLKQTVRQSGYVATLFWKSLASLILACETVQFGNANYEDFYTRYKTTMMLVDLWQLNFGTFDNATSEYLDQSSSGVRRIVAFCLNDGYLAVLLFYGICQKMKADLASQPSTPTRDQLYSDLCSTEAYLKKTAPYKCNPNFYTCFNLSRNSKPRLSRKRWSKGLYSR